MPADNIIVKLDFSNVFNRLHRDYMLERVSDVIPELYKFCHLAYKEHSILEFGEFCLTSQEGSQPGDPLGVLLFCLAIHPILRSTTSPLTIGYMDNITLGSARKEVSDDVQLFKEEGIKIGLRLNKTKCKVIARDHLQPTSSLEGFSVVSSEKASLLGAPLGPGNALDNALEVKCSDLRIAISRLKFIAAHDALILLRSSHSAPRLMHILASTTLFCLLTTFCVGKASPPSPTLV